MKGKLVYPSECFPRLACHRESSDRYFRRMGEFKIVHWPSRPSLADLSTSGSECEAYRRADQPRGAVRGLATPQSDRVRPMQAISVLPYCCPGFFLSSLLRNGPP